MPCSTGAVIWLSTSRGARPGAVVLICTWTGVVSGKASMFNWVSENTPSAEGVRPQAPVLVGYLGVDLYAPGLLVHLRADVGHAAGRLGAAVVRPEGDRLADAHRGHVLGIDVEVDVQLADVAHDEQRFR